MADVKLGSKTFTGIKIVSMNTPDGGKQTFSSGGAADKITYCLRKHANSYSLIETDLITYTGSYEFVTV